MENLTFASMRHVLGWKQNFFGMLFGMGKQAISRVETGERKETLTHKEMLSFVSFLDEKGLLGEYVYWRFKINVSRRFFKKRYPNGLPKEYKRNK